MCLGCVPVVRTSTLDRLYADMPIVILPSWDHVGSALEESTRAIKRSRHKLLLQYWVDKIRNNDH